MSPADGDPQLLYLEPDDEITTVIRRLRGADAGRVVLVAPGRSRATSSVVALRLLARAAADTGRSVALVADASTRALAGEAGVAAFASVADATSPTPSPAEPITPTRAPIHVVRGAGGARPQPPKPIPATDGMEETVAVHLPPPVPPTGGARRLRSRSLIPRWPWLAALLVVALAVGAALLPGATVRITPATEAVGPLAYPIRVDIAGHITDELQATKPGAATGERLEQVPATGTATFLNYSYVQVEVPEGTRVSVAGTVTFVTVERVLAPPGQLTGSDPPIAPGQVSVGITAVEPGTGGNVSAGAIDTVESKTVDRHLQGFTNQRGRRVTNNEPTTDGGEVTHPIIKQSDVDTVVAAIEADIQQQAVDLLAQDVDRLYADPAEAEVSEITIPDELVGTEDVPTFELSGTLTLDRAYASRSDVEAAARASLLSDPAATPAGTAILSDSITVGVDNAVVTGNQLEIRASVSAQAAAKVDQTAARDLVAGKTVEEARRALADLGEVDIELWPPWVDKVPILQFRIEVREEVHTPTDGASPGASVK